VEYEHKDGNWSFKQLKRLAIPHGLDYASILSPGKSICLIAREPFGIIFDSSRNVAAPIPIPQMDEGMDRIVDTFRNYVIFFYFFFFAR